MPASMDIKVLIVEDNPLTSQDLKEIIQESGMTVTGIAKNNSEAFEHLAEEKPDILLVDIMLKGGDSGIDLVSQLKEHIEIPIVYLSANSDRETVKQALATHPASFLTKPYDDKDVIITLELAFNNHYNKVMEEVNEKKIPFIFLKTGNRFEKVDIGNIHYLQAEGSYTRFVTNDREYTLSSNLNNTTGKIKNPSFIRVHRSFVVNIHSVTGVDNDYVFIGEKTIPISRTHKEEVNKVLQKIS